MQASVANTAHVGPNDHNEGAPAQGHPSTTMHASIATTAHVGPNYHYESARVHGNATRNVYKRVSTEGIQNVLRDELRYAATAPCRSLVATQLAVNVNMAIHCDVLHIRKMLSVPMIPPGTPVWNVARNLELGVYSGKHTHKVDRDLVERIGCEYDAVRRQLADGDIDVLSASGFALVRDTTQAHAMHRESDELPVVINRAGSEPITREGITRALGSNAFQFAHSLLDSMPVERVIQIAQVLIDRPQDAPTLASSAFVAMCAWLQRPLGRDVNYEQYAAELECVAHYSRVEGLSCQERMVFAMCMNAPGRLNDQTLDKGSLGPYELYRAIGGQSTAFHPQSDAYATEERAAPTTVPGIPACAQDRAQTAVSMGISAVPNMGVFSAFDPVRHYVLPLQTIALARNSRVGPHVLHALESFRGGDSRMTSPLQLIDDTFCNAVVYTSGVSVAMREVAYLLCATAYLLDAIFVASDRAISWGMQQTSVHAMYGGGVMISGMRNRPTMYALACFANTARDIVVNYAEQVVKAYDAVEDRRASSADVTADPSVLVRTAVDVAFSCMRSISTSITHAIDAIEREAPGLPNTGLTVVAHATRHVCDVFASVDTRIVPAIATMCEKIALMSEQTMAVITAGGDDIMLDFSVDYALPASPLQRPPLSPSPRLPMSPFLPPDDEWFPDADVPQSPTLGFPASPGADDTYVLRTLGADDAVIDFFDDVGAPGNLAGCVQVAPSAPFRVPCVMPTTAVHHHPFVKDVRDVFSTPINIVGVHLQACAVARSQIARGAADAIILSPTGEPVNMASPSDLMRARATFACARAFKAVGDNIGEQLALPDVVDAWWPIVDIVSNCLSLDASDAQYGLLMHVGATSVSLE